MVDVCNQCGLPEDLCVCEAIAREQQKIIVKIEKRKFGKKYTVIDGIEKEANINEIVKNSSQSLPAAALPKKAELSYKAIIKIECNKLWLIWVFPKKLLSLLKSSKAKAFGELRR